LITPAALDRIDLDQPHHGGRAVPDYPVLDGAVSEVAVGQDTIQGKLKDKLADGKSAFVTARVDPALAEKLEAKGITVTGVPFIALSDKPFELTVGNGVDGIMRWLRQRSIVCGRYC
jgi:hypothetical protein